MVFFPKTLIIVWHVVAPYFLASQCDLEWLMSQGECLLSSLYTRCLKILPHRKGDEPSLSGYGVPNSPNEQLPLSQSGPLPSTSGQPISTSSLVNLDLLFWAILGQFLSWSIKGKNDWMPISLGKLSKGILLSFPCWCKSFLDWFLQEDYRKIHISCCQNQGDLIPG